MSHKHSKLVEPKGRAIAKRNGGNGGHNQRSESALAKKPDVRRVFNMRDFHGKKIHKR